jgi:acyl carrier protein
VNVTDARETVLDLLEEIAPEIDLDAVPDDGDLRDAVDLDPLHFLTLVERAHETTGVDVTVMDYDQVRTLSGWVGYLTARLA